MNENASPSNVPSQENAQQIVPAHPKLPDRIEALLEELTVVRLEGRYFCFDRRAVGKRPNVMTYEDEHENLVTIQTSPVSGHPSILAYRVLQAVFRKVTLAQRPYPAVVSFSRRELGRLVGREIFGGKDSKELMRAIAQLEDTKVTLFKKDKSGKRFATLSLRMLANSGFIGEGDEDNPRLDAAVLRLDAYVHASIRKEHFAIFDWGKIETLEPLSAAFFKRLYLHFSNLYQNRHDRKTLYFEKSYADICSEWLGGLKVESYRSDIADQLQNHLEALKRTGLIRSFAIEKMADNKSFKLVFRPGEGFFRDYDLFYLGRGKQAVFQYDQAADQFHIQGPMEGVDYFYRRLHKVEGSSKRYFSRKEADYAKSLIQKFGVEGYQSLVDYAIASARTTNFDMKTIFALDMHLANWQITMEKREQEIAMRRLEMDRRAEEKVQEDYKTFCKLELRDREAKLSPEEREEIGQLAADHVDSSPTFSPSVRETLLRAARNRILMERYPIQTFQDWRRSLG
jgi:hypothetical protein